MNRLQKVLLGLALTLFATFVVLLVWQFGDHWTATPAKADSGQEAPQEQPKPQPVPTYLAGYMQPLSDTANEAEEALLHKDPYQLQQTRRETEQYLERLKTAEGRVIGSFQTSLAGHDASGRVKNIVLASQKLNGTILLPGEKLSFNGILGDSNDPAGGWQKATVIVGKKFEEGYGGGICQVSSTLYNSVLQAGLEIRERYTHSLPVGYVPPGRDATVSYPELDFKFLNSSNTPVRVETTVSGGMVYARILALPSE